MEALGWKIGLLSVGLIAACSAENTSPAACALEACFTEHYFGALTDAPDAACFPVATADRLDRSLEVALFWAVPADDETVVREASRLQRFFRPYGLELQTAHAASDAHLTYAMRGSGAELDAALSQAGIPVDRPLTSDEKHRANLAVGPIIFGDLREFVLGHARVHAINMVVLQHVAAPELIEYLFASPGPAIIGFGLSPALFGQANADDPEHDLWEMTGLRGDFTPVLFIGDADVGDLPGSADNLVAHEMGHALGLPHSTEPGNLMTPGQNRSCNEPLSPSQVEDIRRDLTGEGGGAPPPAPQAFDWLPRVVDSVVRARQKRHGY
jgi:hypothetical protein